MAAKFLEKYEIIRKVFFHYQLTKVTPRQCLEWLTHKVTQNRLARQWTLESLDGWVELYMIAHNSNLVRMGKTFLTFK